MQDDEKQVEKEPQVKADEDWKKSVAEEKERLRQQQGEAEQPVNGPHPPLPEPDIRLFLAGLYTQTLICLGQIEHPATGEQEKNLPEAQYLIDTIAMLQQKTSGNLTPDEGDYVESILYDLRMRFVNATAREEAPAESRETTQEQ